MLLPTFLCIGTQRAGTTWLHSQLAVHSQIFVPLTVKEIHYFDQHYEKGRDWYSRVFAPAAHMSEVTAIGEVTPDYLYSPLAPLRISRDLPGVKLIVILRDPADRAYSQYGLRMSQGYPRSSFEEFIQLNPDAVYRGFYSIQLASYLKFFSKDQIHVLIYEELFSAPPTSLQSVYHFLGVSNQPVVSSGLRNQSYLPRLRMIRRAANLTAKSLRARGFHRIVQKVKHTQPYLQSVSSLPPMDPCTRLFLAKLYEEDVRRLENLINRSLPMWSPVGV